MGVPSNDVTQADVTVASATTTDGTSVALATPAKTFRARVFLKTVVGVGGVDLALQISDVTTFDTASTFVVDTKHVDVTVATSGTFGGYFLELTGSAPLVAGASFMRISFLTGAGTSGVADVELQAA